MRLPWPVIRVLPEDDHFDLLERRRVERVEDQRPRREDHLAGGLFATQKRGQLLHVGFVELVAQGFFPASLELDAIILGHERFPDSQAAEP